LLCDPGSRPLARLDGSDQTLWVDVVVADDEEPLDDIGQRVLRATVVAEDRVHVAISDAQRAGIAQSLAALIGRLRPDEPGGDHVHLEWYHPIDDPAVTDERSPYIAWVFGIPPRDETTDLLRSIAVGTPASAAEVAAAESVLAVRLPSDLAAFYFEFGSANGEVPRAGTDGSGGWLILYPVTELRLRNAEYEWRDHRFVIVGTNGAAEAYVLDYRHDPPQWAVVPFLDLDTDNVLAAGETLAGFVDAIASGSFWARS
jgi:hypothetical protein